MPSISFTFSEISMSKVWLKIFLQHGQKMSNPKMSPLPFFIEREVPPTTFNFHQPPFHENHKRIDPFNIFKLHTLFYTIYSLAIWLSTFYCCIIVIYIYTFIWLLSRPLFLAPCSTLLTTSWQHNFHFTISREVGMHLKYNFYVTI